MRFTAGLPNHNAGMSTARGENPMITLNRRGLLAAVAVVPALALGAPAFAQGGDVTLTHYFTGEFGLKIFNEQGREVRGRHRLHHQEQPHRSRGLQDRHPGARGRRQPARRLQLLGRGADAVRRRCRSSPSHRRHVGAGRPRRCRRQVRGRQRHHCTTASATWCRSTTTTRACSITPRCWRMRASPRCRRPGTASWRSARR